MFARFNWMEQRYHTWMNYYSLFNGALLVAYCTILVSTGKIVEVEGNISNNEFTNLGAKLFYLNCTYWDILTVIAILGVIASYCWYLSMIGHRSWLENWRKILEKEGNMPFEHILYAKTNNAQKVLSKILCKWKQDSVVSLFLYLDSVFKYKHKLVHNQSPV